MGPIDGRNEAEVPYFSLQEYVNRIHVEKNVLEHMEETNHAFDEYLSYLLQFDEYSLGMFFVELLYKELYSSFEMEHSKLINLNLVEEKGLFFDSLKINHKRIKDLHGFVVGNNEDYRKSEVRVSKFTREGEVIFWKGAKSEDVYKFMCSFIDIYKSKSLSVINTNPFLKCALIHLLFVRIHPFTDGNGRTARLLHNMKFANILNDVYGMHLKVSPLNLSPSILLNQVTYAKRINQIYFDLEHDSNEEINLWFDFILNMVDEQLYYILSRRERVTSEFEEMSKMRVMRDSQFAELIAKMKIKK